MVVPGVDGVTQLDALKSGNYYKGDFLAGVPSNPRCPLPETRFREFAPVRICVSSGCLKFGLARMRNESGTTGERVPHRSGLRSAFYWPPHPAFKWAASWCAIAPWCFGFNESLARFCSPRIHWGSWWVVVGAPGRVAVARFVGPSCVRPARLRGSRLSTGPKTCPACFARCSSAAASVRETNLARYDYRLRYAFVGSPRPLRGESERQGWW